jgi:hypothetical protein
MFLPLYGWKHRTIPNEMSFRQTIHGLSNSDRGFKVTINRDEKKVSAHFSEFDLKLGNNFYLCS